MTHVFIIMLNQSFNIPETSAARCARMSRIFFDVYERDSGIHGSEKAHQDYAVMEQDNNCLLCNEIIPCNIKVSLE